MEKSKYSFNMDLSSAKIKTNFKELLKPRPERKLRLNIIKSHTKLFAINKNFTITERGIDCSQKNHNKHYISVGRQQVNEKGIRPNDIMLFPTDPSVSRSHFRIYHQDYFENFKKFDDSSHTTLNVIFNKDFKHNQINQLDVMRILKYNHPENKVAIEDVGTIYGTYVRIKPFGFFSFLTNFLLNLTYKSNNVKGYLNNFSFLKTLDNYYQYDSKKENDSKFFNVIYPSREKVSGLFGDDFDIRVDEDRKVFNSYIDLLKSNFSEDKSSKEIILENNFIIENHIPVVFLNNPRAGLNISKTGTIAEIVEALREEYLSFNSENFRHFIDVISLDKIFESQKFEISSQLFKSTITKHDLVQTFQFQPNFSEFSVLLMIETEGDPCGVMNRKNDVLFFSRLSGRTENTRAFTFNYIRGFLIGNGVNSCYIMNSEVESFLYYNAEVNKWMITDLTKFLNPSVYYSEDYFGLWVCISPDKKYNNRYTSKMFYVKSDDEIKVSETIMKLTIDDK